MTVHFFSIFKFLSIGFLISQSLGCTEKSSDYLDKVVVKVNSSELTAEDFSDLLLRRLSGIHILSAKDSSVIAQAKKAIVQEFIIEIITEDWARKNQIFVRKEQLDAEIKKVRSGYPDDVSFRKSLADEGQSFDVWQDGIKKIILQRLVVEELRKKIPPIPIEKLRDHYQNNKSKYSRPAAVKIRQVLVENENSAKRILGALKDGQTISQLAKKYSLGSEARLGGDLGWIEKGFLAAFDSAFRMNVGQKSSIVKSPFGFHVFEVVDKRTQKNLTFEESKETISNELMSELEQEVYSKWLENQVVQSRVFKDDELIQAIQVHVRGNQ